MTIFLPVLYVGIAFILYATSLHGEFLFDDHTNFLMDPAIVRGDWSRVWKHWPLPFRATSNTIYGLVSRYAHNIYYIVRTDVPESFGFHVVNVVVHGLNASLAYWVMCGVGLGEHSAMITGFLFLCHPLAVNAVAAISNWSTVFSASFYFLSIGFALHHHPFAALLMIPLAISAKEDTVILPVVLGLLGIQQGGLLLCGWPIATFIACAGYSRAKWLASRTGEEGLIAAGFPPSQLEGRAYHLTAFAESVLRLPQWWLGYNQQIDAEIHESSLSRCMLAVVLAGTVLTALWHALAVQTPLATLLIIATISPLVAYWVIRLPDPIAEHRAYVSLLGGSGLIAWVLRGT